MITPTAESVLPGPAAAQPRDRTGLDKDAFLTLLVTQLRHQDPLSPLQPQEFAAQLAQFTSVEQLTQLNDQLAAQTDAVHLGTLVSQTALSASLLGRQIVAEGDQLEITAGTAGQIRVEVGGAGGTATLTLRDDSGAVVATRNLGSLPAGRQAVQLPGDLPAGTYHYEVSVKTTDGADVPVTTYTTGTVDGIYFRNGTIMLRMGALEVPLESLAEIEPGTGGTPVPGSLAMLSHL